MPTVVHMPDHGPITMQGDLEPEEVRQRMIAGGFPEVANAPVEKTGNVVTFQRQLGGEKGDHTRIVV